MSNGKSKITQHYDYIKNNYFTLPIDEIAKYTGLSKNYIQVQASILGITKLRPDIDKNALITDYNSRNYTLRQLEGKYQTSRTSIKKIITDNGLTYRNKSTARQKYTIDTSYFEKIDTEAKAYFFGFILADGNVYKSCLKIDIHKRDKELLESFLKNMKSNHKIYNYGGSSTSIHIVNKKIVYDLEQLGCHPNKTFNIPFPDETIIPHDLMRHFIRGYFDGDGWVIKFHTKKLNMWRLGMMAPESFIIKLQSIMNNISDVKWNYHQDKRVKIDMKTLVAQSSIGIQGAKTVKNVYDFFYKDALYFLSRKKIIFEAIIEESLLHEHKVLKVKVGAKVYDTAKDAAKDIGIKYSAFFYRLKHNPEKYGYEIVSA